MTAALEASNDSVAKALQPRAKLYEDITNSNAIDFILDGPWDVDPSTYKESDIYSESINNVYMEYNNSKGAVVIDDGYMDGHTIVPAWMSALGAIPMAGPLVLSVTDKVARLAIVLDLVLT